MFRYFYFVIVVFYSCNAGIPSTHFISCRDKNITYEGRIAFTTDAAELMWPGTSVKINFEGTGISARLRELDTANYYNVIIDDSIISKFHFDTIPKTYELASGLSNGRHSLLLFKRTEWDKGKTLFYGFECANTSKLLAPSQLQERKMEFFGNSITCGYALEDTVTDSPVGYFENSYDAYAAITARYFNAQCHSTSKSGIGITISWFPLLMPQMYDRLDPTDAGSKWDFSTYTPDLVVINLLQNDYWLVKMPDNEEFKKQFGTKAPDSSFIMGAYKNFVQTIRGKYPNAQIICMLGNMDITSKGSPWPGYVEKATAQLNDKKISTYFAPYKETPGHPKAAEQKILADGLIQFIKQHIQW